MARGRPADRERMRSSPPVRSWSLLVACLVGGSLMIWFALLKLGDPVAFLKAVHEYRILPAAWPRAVNLLALWIPAIELAGGGLLILGIWRRGVALALATMLLTFSGAVAWRGLQLHGQLGGSLCAVKFDCGCGTGEVFLCAKLAENALLLVCMGYLVWSRAERPWSLWRRG